MTKIAILCGGIGRRIRPLSEKIPKPLIEVGGKPILEHVIQGYKSQGFGNFIFCVGYKGQKIVDFLKTKKRIRYYISNEGEKASMLQRIHALRHDFKNDLVVGYGDTFIDVQVKDILKAHRQSKKWVTIVTAKIQSPFGLMRFDSEGVPFSFQEKPILNYYVGYFVINKKAFDSISKNMLKMKDGAGLVSLFKQLIELKQLNSYQHKRMMLTFNTQEELADAEVKFRHFYSINEGRAIGS